MAATVVVQGHATLEVAPDAARFVVVARGEAAQSPASHAAASTIAAAIDELLDGSAAAIRRRSTSGLLVTRAHEWRDGTQQFVGWDTVRSTVVEMIDPDAIGPLFAELAEVGAVAGSIEWVIDPANPGHAEARRLAALDARERAGAYAEALGGSLGPVLEVREPATKDLRPPEARAYAMAASSPVADGGMAVEAPQLRLEATVDVTFGLVSA